MTIISQIIYNLADSYYLDLDDEYDLDLERLVLLIDFWDDPDDSRPSPDLRLLLSFLTGSLGNFPLEDFDFSGDLDVEDFSGVFDRDLDENLLFRFFASFFFFL